MEKIKTFELDRWSEPDEQHRVRHIGMADAKETFEKLIPFERKGNASGRVFSLRCGYEDENKGVAGLQFCPVCS